MSKLGEALQRKRRGEAGRAMGFGAAARSKERALLLGVLATSASEAADALAAGVDFVTVAATDASAAAEAAKALNGLIGTEVSSFAAGEVETLKEAGIDFVIAEPEATAAGVADDEDLGLVLAATEGADETDLRALAPLELDAVLVRETAEGLTLARRISLTRVATLCGAPLLVAVTPAATTTDLGALRETGAGGVVVPGGTTSTALASLIEALEAVPPKSRRNSRRGDFAIVPSGARGDDDDEEREDDE